MERAEMRKGEKDRDVGVFFSYVRETEIRCVTVCLKAVQRELLTGRG